MTIIEIIMLIGGLSSALMAFLGLVGAIAGKSKKGKEKFKGYVKKSFGIDDIMENVDDIKSKLTDHLKCEEDRIAEAHKQSSALLSMLRKDLKYMCEDAVRRGRVTFKEREMISASYKAYSDMNGNSFICGVVKKTLDLPIKEDDE